MRKTLEPKVKPRLGLEADSGTEAIVGQGLPSLHPYTQIPLDWIEADPDQPRQYFDPEKLEELAADLRLHGIDQPLFVRTQRPNRYTLIAGERRLRAARIAELRTVPVLVRDDLGPSEANLLRLRENLQREDLTPLEIARGFQRYKELTGSTWDAIALEFGRTKKSVLEIVGLTKAPEKVRELLETRQISPAHVSVLAPLPPDQQIMLAESAAEHRLTVRELRDVRGQLETVPVGTDPNPNGLQSEESEISGDPTEWSHFKVTPTALTESAAEEPENGSTPSEGTEAAPNTTERSHSEATPPLTLPSRPKPLPTKEIRVSVDADRHRKLRHLAADTTGGSVAALVREALDWVTERFDSGDSLPWKITAEPKE